MHLLCKLSNFVQKKSKEKKIFLSVFHPLFCMCTVFENHKKSLFVSAANYVYILSGQKFIKNTKNAQFGEFLKT